jgi:hypothetical protein
VCHEFWADFYKQMAPDAPSLKSFAQTLQSFLASVHTAGGDAVAVNAAAMQQIREDNGAKFDAEAKRVTERFAKEA